MRCGRSLPSRHVELIRIDRLRHPSRNEKPDDLRLRKLPLKQSLHRLEVRASRQYVIEDTDDPGRRGPSSAGLH